MRQPAGWVNSCRFSYLLFIISHRFSLPRNAEQLTSFSSSCSHLCFFPPNIQSSLLAFLDPKQEYRVPLTCAQEIGWWLPMDPSVKPEDAIPWMRTQRHPQLRSPMTNHISCKLYAKQNPNH
uniref:Uncharacterized protein n=1 Tax=Varanus komodoensis TaxID=61221 RepID=A0A8D2IZZ5_VARKO